MAIFTHLIGREVESSINETSQVYKATHDGAGNRLPHMNKSFISFTYGGKAIEDFNLIVVNKGDRMERTAYAPFSDLTSNYDTLDGQLYWGSKFEPNQLELTLATDEITDKQINDFKEWFAPGNNRELILSEYPNRAIFARVASSPALSLLPFEKKTSVIIAGVQYATSTTIYKGEITLSFIMDEPHWFSKLNFMPNFIDKVTLTPLIVGTNEWNVNENKVESLKDKDMIKIMLEDGIPHQDSVKGSMFLGNNTLAIVSEARVGDENMTSEEAEPYAHTDITYLGIVVGGSNGIPISSNTPGYLFYSGTAPSYPIIQFSLNINEQNLFDSNSYIKIPKNSIQNPSLDTYSNISIGDKVFEFTTPSMLTGYNKAIQIFKQNSNLSKTELLDKIRLEINERYVRAWAVSCLNAEQDNINLTNLINKMKNFFQPDSAITFIINSKTGEAIGKFNINVSTNPLVNTYQLVEENVGDMIRSNYLTIEGRNYLNSNGEIDPEQDCKIISTNEELSNVLIFFRNMYL